MDVFFCPKCGKKSIIKQKVKKKNTYLFVKPGVLYKVFFQKILNVVKAEKTILC